MILKRCFCGLWAALLLFSSCATGTGQRIPYKKLEASIVRGQTTQNEVIQLMGSPNIVTKNSKGEEVWTYTRKSYNSETGSVSGGVVLSGGARPSSSGYNTASFDLILTFDQADIVRDYSLISNDL